MKPLKIKVEGLLKAVKKGRGGVDIDRGRGSAAFPGGGGDRWLRGQLGQLDRRSAGVAAHKQTAGEGHAYAAHRQQHRRKGIFHEP